MAKKSNTLANKKPSSRKTKAASRKTKAASRKTIPKKTLPDTNSVDGIIRKFEKDRSSKTSRLKSVRSKIEDLKSKVESFQNQIVSLTEDEKVTQHSLDQLDTVRDKEVSQLLQRLGIKVVGVPAVEIHDSNSEKNEVSDGTEKSNSEESSNGSFARF